jgi:hypothetical protein
MIEARMRKRQSNFGARSNAVDAINAAAPATMMIQRYASSNLA